MGSATDQLEPVCSSSIAATLKPVLPVFCRILACREGMLNVASRRTCSEHQPDDVPSISGCGCLSPKTMICNFPERHPLPRLRVRGGGSIPPLVNGGGPGICFKNGLRPVRRYSAPVRVTALSSFVPTEQGHSTLHVLSERRGSSCSGSSVSNDSTSSSAPSATPLAPHPRNRRAESHRQQACNHFVTSPSHGESLYSSCHASSRDAAGADGTSDVEASIDDHALAAEEATSQKSDEKVPGSRLMSAPLEDRSRLSSCSSSSSDLNYVRVSDLTREILGSMASVIEDSDAGTSERLSERSSSVDNDQRFSKPSQSPLVCSTSSSHLSASKEPESPEASNDVDTVLEPVAVPVSALTGSCLARHPVPCLRCPPAIGLSESPRAVTPKRVSFSDSVVLTPKSTNGCLAPMQGLQECGPVADTTEACAEDFPQGKLRVGLCQPGSCLKDSSSQRMEESCNDLIQSWLVRQQDSSENRIRSFSTSNYRQAAASTASNLLAIPRCNSQGSAHSLARLSPYKSPFSCLADLPDTHSDFSLSSISSSSSPRSSKVPKFFGGKFAPAAISKVVVHRSVDALDNAKISQHRTLKLDSLKCSMNGSADILANVEPIGESCSMSVSQASATVSSTNGSHVQDKGFEEVELPLPSLGVRSSGFREDVSEVCSYNSVSGLEQQAEIAVPVPSGNVAPSQGRLDDTYDEDAEIIRSVEKQLLHQLVNQIDHLDARLIEAERLRGQWSPVAQITLTTVQEHVDEITLFNKTVSGYETLIDNMDGTAKELRHLHGVKLSAVTEGTLQQVHDRWKRLRLDASVRLRDLQGLQGQPTLQEPGGSGGLSALQGSVESPWERGAALNKVPYYINHNTKTTQWDHPKMTDLYHTLSELNDVKFAAYRTAMKLRCIQKAICLDMVDLKDVIVSAFKADRALANNDQLVDIDEMITVLLAVFENVDPKRKEVINIPQSVDMTLNWLLNVYDSGRIGKIRVLSFKVGVVLLSRARIEEKYAYLFSEATSGSGLMNSKKLGLLLHDAVQIPRQLGEIAAFGGSNIEPSVRSCFEKAKSPQQIDSAQFLDWTSAEPQSLVWVPVLHRLAAAETAKHEAKCNICKEYPIIGFRYRCLKCFNYDLCQSCFWSGRVSKTHRITHPMHQYSLATTTGEDLSDFVKLMKNKFKSRKYRSRPPKKLGYLPVQTIMEGSSIETPSIPATPDMSFSFSSFDSTPSSPTKFRFDVINEEHRLIQQMAQSLNGDANGSSPQSPSQILARLDSEQKQDINDIIRELEDEHKSLEAEYTRLKSVRAPPREASSILPRGAEFAGEAEVVAEAKILKQHKGRLEARMQILEDHNRQLEAQLQRLRQLLEQPPGERDRAAFSMNVSGPPSPTRLTMTVAADASPGGSLPARANRGAPVVNGYTSPGDGGGRVQNVSR